MTALLHDAFGPAQQAGFGSVPGFAIMLGNSAFPQDTVSNIVLPAGGRAIDWNIGYSDMTTRCTLGSGASTLSGGEFGCYAYLLNNCTYVIRPWAGWAVGCAGDVFAPICHDAANETTGITASILYLGGLCDAKVAHYVLNTSTGNQSFTGLGFQPDAVLVLGCMPIGQLDNPGFNIGAFDADGNQWAMSARANFFTGPFFYGYPHGRAERFRQFRDDACLLALATNPGIGPASPEQRATFVSMDPDGFTLNLQAAGSTGGANTILTVLAIKPNPGSGQVKVGVGLAGQTAYNCGFAPDAFFFGTVQSIGAGPEDHEIACVGAVTDSVQRAAYGEALQGPVNASAPFPAGVYSTTHAVYTGGATATASLTPTGALLDWDYTDGQAYKVGWVAFQIDDDLTGVPEATATAATNAICTTAIAHGSVTPNTTPGDNVCVFIDYGLTTSYGDTISLGCTYSGTSSTPITQLISGLDEETTYHYRIRIVDGDCTYVSNDIEFTTSSCIGLHLRPRILA